jgi:zinc transporter, ZIP family
VIGLVALVVGGSLVVGALVAALVQLPERLAQTITAVGAGILLAAIAFELVPEADDRAGTTWTTVGLIGGTLFYVAFDAWLTRDDATERMRRSGHAAAAGQPMTMSPADSDAARGEAIVAGIVIDGVPESFAVGLTVAEGSLGVALLVGIVLGNVVEAYGGAQPIRAAGKSIRFLLALFTLIGVALATATVVGGTSLSGGSGNLVGTAEAVAAGAVLAVISISIVPQAFAVVSWWVAIAMIAGFSFGYVLS